MSKRQSQYRVPQFWLSKTNAAGEPFAQIGASLLQSEEFQGLSYSERWVYLCMVIEAKGRISFKFTRATAARYGINNQTLRRATEKLKAKGFIEYTSSKTTRTPNEYKFSRAWKTPP